MKSCLSLLGSKSFILVWLQELPSNPSVVWLLPSALEIYFEVNILRIPSDPDFNHCFLQSYRVMSCGLNVLLEFGSALYRG